MATADLLDLDVFPVTCPPRELAAAREMLASEPQRWEDAIPFRAVPDCAIEHDWVEDQQMYHDAEGFVFKRCCLKCGRQDEACVWTTEIPDDV